MRDFFLIFSYFTVALTGIVSLGGVIAGSVYLWADVLVGHTPWAAVGAVPTAIIGVAAVATGGLFLIMMILDAL